MCDYPRFKIDVGGGDLYADDWKALEHVVGLVTGRDAKHQVELASLRQQVKALQEKLEGKNHVSFAQLAAELTACKRARDEALRRLREPERRRTTFFLKDGPIPDPPRPPRIPQPKVPQPKVPQPRRVKR